MRVSFKTLSAGSDPVGSRRRQGVIAPPLPARATAVGIALLLAACLCATVALLGGGVPPAAAEPACPNEALREEQHATYLPDCRAYEMVSPPEKNGGDVMGSPNRTRVSIDGDAVTFGSRSGFADAIGGGVGIDYMAERSAFADPGGNGWSTHAITPPQASSTILTGVTASEPLYSGEFSPDLSHGVFRAWSPLTNAPAVAGVRNLYLRDDLRAPGVGNFQLVSDCPFCLSLGKSLVELDPTPNTITSAELLKPTVVGASADFGIVYFESAQRLTENAPPPLSTKLYESDHGAVRLAGVRPNGVAAAKAIAGRGFTRGANLSHTSHPISTDGSRAVFTVPQGEEKYEGDLYMRISGRSTIRLDASERTSPQSNTPSWYWSASTDGSRVFFSSKEALTDDATGEDNLYMWKRAEANEQQSVKVDASGGTFTLSFEGSATSPLAFNAGAGVVQGALETLKTVKLGNVSVSGGPGSVGGATPYLITFEGDFAGANVSQLQANGSALSGGAHTAVVATTKPIHNLTYLNADQEPGDAANETTGVFGVSGDGSYVYFAALGQLVAGAPKLEHNIGIYLWHEGVVSYVGEWFSAIYDAQFSFDGEVLVFPLQPAVSPDGRHLLFNSSSGKGLLSAHGGIDYDQGDCKGPLLECQELYVYSADTDTLQCASCIPSGAPATSYAWSRSLSGQGATILPDHVSRPLSDDGRYVFYSTADALLPAEDTNGKFDAYEYDTQTEEVHLLSSGTSDSDSYFLESSPDGHDALIITREHLVGWDIGSNVDLYDVRVGGGFPEPVVAPAPCAGESSCRESSPASPPTPPVASASLLGPGNPPIRRGCPRGRHLVKRGDKTRCVNRKHHHKRGQKTHRRASR